LKIHLPTDGHGRKKILISGGIHGDEPAGVETICVFLERGEFRPFEKNWEFTLLPCLNPFGYEYGTRNNHEDMDLNRLFKSAMPPAETLAAMETLAAPFDVTLELHEDSDSPGFYLYQKDALNNAPALGRKIVDAVSRVMPINMNSIIEAMPAENGVLHRLSDPEKMEWWPMALYAYAKGARCCLTLETATKFPLTMRVAAHLTAIKKVLTDL
jgi:predicted deacylase